MTLHLFLFCFCVGLLAWFAVDLVCLLFIGSLVLFVGILVAGFAACVAMLFVVGLVVCWSCWCFACIVCLGLFGCASFVLLFAACFWVLLVVLVGVSGFVIFVGCSLGYLLLRLLF